jgi:DNA/RNA endonuclease YhcR with UshA esterase domain
MKKAALVFAGLLAAAPLFAQEPPPPPPPEGAPQGRGPGYDATKEVTLSGIIEEVKEMTFGRSGRTATGIMLKTEKETLEIRLAPAEFLAEQKLTLAKGDKVQVTGAKMTFREREVFRVREIKKGEQAVALLDKDGRPLFARPPQPQQ